MQHTSSLHTPIDREVLDHLSCIGVAVFVRLRDVCRGSQILYFSLAKLAQFFQHDVVDIQPDKGI